MFSEDDLLPISGLQHALFCERQWALIHIEGVWEENRLTAEGKYLHERVHEMASESRGDVRIARGLRLRSLRLGLTGQADVVEFRRVLSDECGVMSEASAVRSDECGVMSKGGNGVDGLGPSVPALSPASYSPQPNAVLISLPGVRGFWRPFPVEYKRGKPKANRCDEVQLCAQALCLEEMLGVAIPAGALFYGTTRRRKDIAFDDTLRATTESLAAHLHALFEARTTPKARYEKKCDACSLYPVCLPKTTGVAKRVGDYLTRAVAAGGEEIAEA